jgi:hypothetical protein
LLPDWLVVVVPVPEGVDWLCVEGVELGEDVDEDAAGADEFELV